MPRSTTSVGEKHAAAFFAGTKLNSDKAQGLPRRHVENYKFFLYQTLMATAYPDLNLFVIHDSDEDKATNGWLDTQLSKRVFREIRAAALGTGFKEDTDNVVKTRDEFLHSGQ